MSDLLWWLTVALTVAGARAGYRWHTDRRIPPLDPFWTEPPAHRPGGTP